jgi:transcriptional regulator with XRE-family HTH domain
MKADIKKIISFRKAKGISVKKFAELLDVTTKTIYNWENGVSLPAKTDLMAIAHLLNIKLSDISNYKTSGFTYFKPGLHKSGGIKESTKLLKSMISDTHCGDNAKLLPLLHAEEEILRLTSENNRLTKQISRYKLIYDLIDTPIYIKNVKRIVTFVNQAFINILPENLNEYDIIGHKFSDVFLPKEYLLITKIENEAFNGSHIKDIPTMFTVKNSPVKCYISIKPIHIENSNPQEIITTIKISI